MKQISAFAYRFLSHAFAYPNEAFLPTLRESLALRPFAATQGRLRSGQTLTGETASTLTAIVDLLAQEPLETLQAEYTRLFINGYPSTPCPPYESAYREGRLMGRANVQVRAIYLQWHVDVDPSLADHLSTELEFMAFLSIATKLDHISHNATDAAHSFRVDHLRTWLPAFAADLATHARLPGYRALADALRPVA
jgi:TorA maturation chaperone TorD